MNGGITTISKMLLPAKSLIGHSAKRVTHNPTTTQTKNTPKIRSTKNAAPSPSREKKFLHTMCV